MKHSSFANNPRLIARACTLIATGAWLALFTPSHLEAKTTTATSDGDWSGAIWDNGAPVDGDDVVIGSGKKVTLSATTPILSIFLIFILIQQET